MMENNQKGAEIDNTLVQHNCLRKVILTYDGEYKLAIENRQTWNESLFFC